MNDSLKQRSTVDKDYELERRDTYIAKLEAQQNKIHDAAMKVIEARREPFIRVHKEDLAGFTRIMVAIKNLQEALNGE